MWDTLVKSDTVLHNRGDTMPRRTNEPQEHVLHQEIAKMMLVINTETV